MQPYFFPYAGYFRLMAAADIFVIYDCVQFPRRGYVHRCNVPDAAGAETWLTLPLARQPRDVLIRDLEFASGARGELDRRLARLPWLARAASPSAEAIRAHLFGPLPSVIAHLEAGLELTARLLGLSPRLIRSSTLRIAPGLRGEDRILAICEEVGATHYLNAPGGRGLYSPRHFAGRNLSLNFLPPYSGPYRTMLHDLVTGDAAAIAADVRASALMLEAEADRPGD